mgnify:FL=1
MHFFAKSIIMIVYDKNKGGDFMSKKVMKILTVLLLIAMLCNICTTVFADFDGFAEIKPASSQLATSVQNIGGYILGVAQVIGMVVAVVMLVVLAIKYISAAPNDKAEIKKHAVVYIVGAIVLFAASGILQIIKNVALIIS